MLRLVIHMSIVLRSFKTYGLDLSLNMRLYSMFIIIIHIGGSIDRSTSQNQYLVNIISYSMTVKVINVLLYYCDPPKKCSEVNVAVSVV